MKKVYNIDEAMKWFLENSEGGVICVKGESEKVANDFPTAEIFFKS